jgi:hypothetical protein
MKQDLLKHIDDFSKGLQKASKWPNTINPFGHVGSAEDYYIFKFYCYVKVLHDLNEFQNVKIVGGTAKGYIFPKGPAKKNGGWSRFDIYNQSGDCLYQVCSGTDIALSNLPDVSFSPDISFQKPDASDEPTQNDVVLIMDAKYKKNGIDFGNIKEMAEVVRSLETADASNIALKFNKLTELKTNCLLSNGGISSKHSKYCEMRFIRQIGQFNK